MARRFWPRPHVLLPGPHFCGAHSGGCGRDGDRPGMEVARAGRFLFGSAAARLWARPDVYLLGLDPDERRALLPGPLVRRVQTDAPPALVDRLSIGRTEGGCALRPPTPRSVD